MATQTQTNPTIEEIRKLFAYRGFKYIDIKESVILHFVRVGWCGWLAVIGHPEDASYEWVARDDGEHTGDNRQRFMASNRGYGGAVAALRDGLIVMEPRCNGDSAASEDIRFEVRINER